MRYIIPLVFFCFIQFTSSAQDEMTQNKLFSIIETMADSIGGGQGQWSFKVGEMWLMCLTDTNHDRMRIITPIIEVAEMESGEMERCLQANFHSALDVKYCIADGILWSAFIHPLSALNPDQVEDAIKQVFVASATYGTLYSSSELVFPGDSQPAPEKKKKIDRS